MIKWILNRVTWGVWLTLGRGMGLYLYNILVVLEGSPNRMFLCFYKVYDMKLATLHVDDLIWSILLYMMMTLLMLCYMKLDIICWSFVGFTWLSKVMGFHLVIAIVILVMCFEYGSCICCKVMNGCTFFVIIMWCSSFLGYVF